MRLRVHIIMTTALCALLLTAGANAMSVDFVPSLPSQAASDDRNMQIELFNAAIDSSTDRLIELLRRGASPNTKNGNGTTALYVCADIGNIAGVEALLAAGANPDIDWNNETPLDIAIINSHIEVVRRLLAAGAHTETFSQEYGADVPVSAALVNAAASKNDEIFTLVLESGADVNSRNFHGHRPLLSAAINGYTKRVRTLLAKGADVNGRSLHNETALQYAAEEGHTETARALLEAGAEIDARDEEGWTALLSAAFQGRAETVALLLAEGAKTELRTSDGDTALLVALANTETVAVLKMLVSGGADCTATDKKGHGALYHLERNEHLSQAEKRRLAELLKSGGARE